MLTYDQSVLWHLRAITQEVLMNTIHKMCSKITLLKLPPHIPGGNELIDMNDSSPTVHQQERVSMKVITYNSINICYSFPIYDYES